MAKRKTKPAPPSSGLPLHLALIVRILSDKRALAILSTIVTAAVTALIGTLLHLRNWAQYNQGNNFYNLQHSAWVDEQLVKVPTTQPNSNPIDWRSHPGNKDQK